MMDDVEQNTWDLQWAKKVVKSKTDDVTGQDLDWPRLVWKMPVGDARVSQWNDKDEEDITNAERT